MNSFPSLKQVFDNPAVAAAVIFCVAAALGQLLHAVKKWTEGEVECVWSWISSSPRRTVGALLGNATGMLVFIQTGVLEPIYQAPNGWWALILFGMTNGFSADSALNKATRNAWSPEERAAKAGT